MGSFARAANSVTHILYFFSYRLKSLASAYSCLPLPTQAPQPQLELVQEWKITLRLLAFHLKCLGFAVNFNLERFVIYSETGRQLTHSEDMITKQCAVLTKSAQEGETSSANHHKGLTNTNASIQTTA